MKCSMCGKEIEGSAVLSPTLDETKRHMCSVCAKRNEF